MLRLLRLLGTLRLGAGSVEAGLIEPGRGGLAAGRLVAVLLVDIDVDGRHGDVDVQGCVFAFEFHGLLGVGDGGEGSAKNVAADVAVDVPLGLLHFYELGFALKIIEQEDAGIFREAQSGGDLRKVGAFGFAGVGFLGFFVERGGFGNGGGGAVFLVF